MHVVLSKHPTRSLPFHLCLELPNLHCRIEDLWIGGLSLNSTYLGEKQSSSSQHKYSCNIVDLALKSGREERGGKKGDSTSVMTVSLDSCKQVW